MAVRMSLDELNKDYCMRLLYCYYYYVMHNAIMLLLSMVCQNLQLLTNQATKLEAKAEAWTLEANAEAEAWTLEAEVEAKAWNLEAEAEAWTLEAEAAISVLESEARPQGLISLTNSH